MSLLNPKKDDRPDQHKRQWFGMRLAFPASNGDAQQKHRENHDQQDAH